MPCQRGSGFTAKECIGAMNLWPWLAEASGEAEEEGIERSPEET